MAPARLILDRKLLLDDGRIIQIRIWRLPEADAERPHGLKYSLFFGRAGERIIGYDNEKGKGDHRHHRSREEPYRFSSLEQLIRDFENDVEREMMG
ncbi:conserved protein of unknown function [Pseudorhizobium banfieldiae]|uniref:Uncharacterized protein n=1 Tax=Pseudorhizobium banfieldiae TaxID=1125847 RepID=L0NE71_9HYPH|nr:DUF6516 family protein [Pseudorhizobium banfieldiae]CAD6603083.1 peptidylprolyl isomerase [arsenite-oxidising bacterium NT-25]CCF18612.1 conserved protein of unknown function [Pseudorhizobium banfieldiae]